MKLTIEELNQKAIAEMFEKGKEQLNSIRYDLSLQDMIDFIKAVHHFSDEFDGRSSALIRFLMADVDYSNPVEHSYIIPRYKSLQFEGGLRNAIRDWQNRYEMGK